MSKKQNELERLEKNSIVTRNMDGGLAGFEEMDENAFAIPMLSIVQPLTPVFQSEDKHESIKLGAIYDNISQIGYKTIRVIPVLYRQRWVEWKPRTAGGGLAAIHTSCPTDAIQTDNALVMPNGNTLVDTRQHYVVFLDQSELYCPALISMKSTAIRVSKNWCTQMRMNRSKTIDASGRVSVTTLNMYQRSYELSTIQVEKNSNKWHQWVVKMLPDPVEGYALDEAVAFYNLLRENRVDVEQTYQQYVVDDTEY